MKAKECFELAFSEEDRMYRNSFYENCGLAYLRVLFLLKLDYKFQKCYSKVSKYYKDEIELYKMKAEVDARYSYKINCIFRKNCASVPEERSAIPLQTEQSSAG